MKIQILVSDESSYFSDYRSEILAPKCVSFWCYEQKGANLHKSVVTTPDSYSLLSEVVKTFLQLVWKPLDLSTAGCGRVGHIWIVRMWIEYNLATIWCVDLSTDNVCLIVSGLRQKGQYLFHYLWIFISCKCCL